MKFYVILVLVSITNAVSQFPLNQGQDPSENNCEKCREIISSAQKYLSDPVHYDSFREIALKLCTIYIIPNDAECAGFISNFEGTVSSVFFQLLLDPEKICKNLEYCDLPVYVPEDFESWASEVLKDKPQVIGPQSMVSEDLFTFVHITDIHLDLLYQKGADEMCELTTCCRNGTGNAGNFGSGKCDLPMATLEAALLQIKDLAPEFVIMTGDVPPHDSWENSKQSNLEHQKAVASAFARIIPEIPVFPIYGNHESFPVNQYEYKTGGGWLPGPFAKYWGLGKGIEKQLKKHAGYSQLVPNTNLRIIALDTQTGNNQNIWLLLNSTDPQGIVSWLHKKLVNAEKKNEKVYLIGHIPFGFSDTLTAYSKHLNVLIDRFENVIVGIFFGHLHYDTFQVNIGHYSKEPTGIQWISPSFTTWVNHNPGFRVFKADKSSKEIIDFDQYQLDLTKANSEPEKVPFWEIVYSFKAYYGLTDLSVQSVFALASNIADSETLALQYYFQLGNGSEPITSCDETCRKNLQCQLTHGVFDEVAQCQHFFYGNTYQKLDSFYGNWVYKYE